MVSIAYPLWVWKEKVLEQGEWTKTQALVLATAVEGMLLAKEGAGWDIECLGLLRSFRGLRGIRSERAGSATEEYFNSHRTTYAVDFQLPTNSFEVLVMLRCDFDGNDQWRHVCPNWVYRDVQNGRIPTDHRIKGLVWAFGGQIEGPLTQRGFCGYKPNLIYR